MRTEQEYRKRLHSYKRNIFMKGERIGRDHPALEPAVNLIAESYRLLMNPEYADLFTTASILVKLGLRKEISLSKVAMNL